jgi:hypothetical protein
MELKIGVVPHHRITNGFSQKIQNHAAMVAIDAVDYSFARIHKTLKALRARLMA